MQICLCDRCDKETETIHTVTYFLSGYGQIHKELCGDCFEEFLNWIEEEPIEDEGDE